MISKLGHFLNHKTSVDYSQIYEHIKTILADAMEDGVSAIDQQFGEFHAAAHPALVCAYLQAFAMLGLGSMVNLATQDLAKSGDDERFDHRGGFE